MTAEPRPQPAGERPEPIAVWVEEAHKSLRFRFAGYPDDAKLVVNTADGTGFNTREYFLHELPLIAQRYAGQAGEPHVYTRMSVLHRDTKLAPGSRGRKADSYGCTLLWVDIDPDGTEDFRERKLEELRSFQPAPSAIEDSGRGYYAFWRIPFTQDWQRIERINKWLGVQLNGEGFDVTRVLRLPGTFNAKPDCQRFARVIEQHPERTYQLEEFEEADLTVEEQVVQTQDYEPEALPLGFEDRIRSASGKLWKRIYSQQTALEVGAAIKPGTVPPQVDRHRNDMSIAVHLLSLGVPPAQVYAVLTHPTWFSGSKYRESYRDDYVKLTIDSARRWVGPGKLNKPSLIGDHLREQHTLLCYLSYWYRYDPDRGVYVEAETELQLAIQSLAGEKWSANLESGVFAYLEPHAKVAELPGFELVNVENGMLDWRTGTLHEHSPSYRSIMQVQAAWKPDVDCRDVDAFVAAVLPEETIPIWWMFCGYCLYTRLPLPYRCLLALVGPRRTGKSTLLQALSTFLGTENCSAVTLADLCGHGNQFTTAALVGKMLNTDLDAPYEIPMRDIHTLKKLAVGEAVPIERKFHEASKAVLPIKIAFVMNDYPSFGVTDEAFYDRWVVLETRKDVAPFTRQNPKTRLNAHLALLSQARNRDAWLRRSIEGLQALQRAGDFPETEATIRAKDELRRQSDSVYSFWCECTREGDPLTEIPLQRFYNAYRTWTGDTGAGSVKIKKFRARTAELVQEKLLPGMQLLHDNQWRVTGRRVAYLSGPVVVRVQPSSESSESPLSSS